MKSFLGTLGYRQKNRTRIAFRVSFYSSWWLKTGLRVSKILQVFSKQAIMIDTLIEYFAGEYHSGSISLPPLSRPDSPQRRLSNKLSRLALATHGWSRQLARWSWGLEHRLAQADAVLDIAETLESR
ncbi:unnamed protein product [Plutella xylostella]|uniref:(diamondback moth) hypothetical protein n=1 Tax=Plutella xylostella TaxID=51655 RepID=A0A8S4FJB7_PLUXY|nr:unnamed protein product [Plutella xylostella]